jgi:hypothetical protein
MTNFFEEPPPEDSAIIRVGILFSIPLTLLCSIIGIMKFHWVGIPASIYTVTSIWVLWRTYIEMEYLTGIIHLTPNAVKAIQRIDSKKLFGRPVYRIEFENTECLIKLDDDYVDGVDELVRSNGILFAVSNKILRRINSVSIDFESHRGTFTFEMSEKQRELHPNRKSNR